MTLEPTNLATAEIRALSTEEIDAVSGAATINWKVVVTEGLFIWHDTIVEQKRPKYVRASTSPTPAVNGH
jgi:hypothetical protein